VSMTAHSSAPSYPIAQGSKRILLSDMPRGQRIAAIGQLLVGYERMDWLWDYLLSQDLIQEWEVVLYDHIQCRNCHAATPLECRSSLGGMRYTGLIRAGVLMYQRPCFGAIQCLGPTSWLAAYNRRVQLGENYLPADARRPIAATAQPAPPRPQAARPYDIAGLTNRVARGFRP